MMFQRAKAFILVDLKEGTFESKFLQAVTLSPLSGDPWAYELT